MPAPHGENQMSEGTEQREIVKWYRETYPEYARSLRISQTGGHIGKGKSAAIRNAHSRSMGRVDGESDIAILLPRGPYGCLMMEYKASDSMYQPTQVQRDYIDYHNEIGNLGLTCRGVDIAKAAITQFMELPDEAG